MLNLRLQLYFEARDNQPHAPDGPGWYLVASSTDEGELPLEVIPRVRITNEEALHLAKQVDNTILSKPLNRSPGFEPWDLSLHAAMEHTIKEAAEVIQKQLKDAEQAVANLERLRQRAKEFDFTASDEYNTQI